MESTDSKEGWQEWFERIWMHREEVLYRSLFGGNSRGIFTIPANMFTGTFRQESYDPRWLYYGVFEFTPTADRDSWLYVTSGMSNDWEAEKPDATKPSGLGCEFVFETTQQSEWAILRLLHLMTFQILICHGRFSGRGPLSDFDRIPLHGPIWPESSMLTCLMLAPPKKLPRICHLDSGSFDLYQIVGISDGERDYAKSHGGPALLEMLLKNDFFPITDPNRAEINFVDFL
jgi:hypothetical protein